MWRCDTTAVILRRQLSFLLLVVVSTVAARKLHQDPDPDEKSEDDDGVPLWLYFLIPVISGLVGYGTNVIALKMTFHPVEFVGWRLWQPKGQPFGLFGWQGIVPAKSSVMAGRLVDLFTEKLIDVAEVFGRVDPEAVKQCCKEGTKAITRRSVEEIVKSIIPAVWQALPQYVKDEVLLVVEKESAHFTLLLMERVKNRILEVLDLKGLVQQWAEENKKIFVEVFLEIGQTEYRFVEWSGWWFGLLFGGVQALIYRFYGEWWVLPVAGLLVGYLTNLAAIKLIFEPAEPKKILGCFTIQGVFLKRQHEAAAMIAELSEREFMRVDLFFDEIINGKNKHMFHAMLQEVTEEYLDGVSTTAEKIAAPLILGDNGAQRVREIVVKTVMQEIGNVFPAAYGGARVTMESTMTGSRVEQNLRHIVRFEAKPYPQPQSPTAVTRGFERVAFPKIVSQLSAPEVIIRQKALLGVLELLHSPIGYVQCVGSGVVKPLTTLLEDENTVVRRRAAEAVEVVVIKELGCRTMVQHNTFAALVVALTDSELEIRDACYRALLEASRFQCTLECLVGMGTTLPRLMDLVLQESLKRSEMGLKILVCCAGMHRNEEALVQLIDVSKALPSLTNLLHTGRHWRIQEGSAALISLLASRKDAKVACVGEGTVQHLLELLNHCRLSLDNAALCALGIIAIANEGKQAIVDADGIPTLLQKLSSEHESVLRHVLECITNVSESPTCRAELRRLQVVDFLKNLYEITTCEDIRRSISQAIRQIEFVNWPYELPLGSNYEPFKSEDEELSELVE